MNIIIDIQDCLLFLKINVPNLGFLLKLIEKMSNINFYSCSHIIIKDNKQYIILLDIESQESIDFKKYSFIKEYK